MGLSLNVELARQDGVQTASSVGAGSCTLNLVHLDSFQSEAPGEVKQGRGERDGGAALHKQLLAKVLLLL